MDLAAFEYRRRDGVLRWIFSTPWPEAVRYRSKHEDLARTILDIGTMEESNRKTRLLSLRVWRNAR